MSKLTLIKPQGTILQLGETEYNLVYDFNSFAELEREFGDVQKAFEVLAGNAKTSDLLKIVKAGLVSSEKQISNTELGSYLTPSNMGAVVGIVNEALTVAMPSEEKGKKSKN